MRLPPLPDAKRYVGMYVFDFGDWVSVGYTAEEIEVLLSSEAHRDGRAFRIHRVDERGCVEMRGVSARELDGEEIILFASRDADRAAGDFVELRSLASQRPGPCGVELVRVDLPELDPRHAVGLIYPRHASCLVSSWLSAVGFSGGDLVMGGEKVLAAYRRAGVTPLERCCLKGLDRYRPRSKEEILRTVCEPIQR